MKTGFLVVTLAVLAFGSVARVRAANDTYDPVGNTSIPVPGPDGQKLLESKLTNFKDVIKNFKLAVDSDTEILSPVQYGGTVDQPTLKATVEKCVFIVCETADLDIEFFAAKVSGACDLNLLITADLTRSSALISDLYSKLTMEACFQKNTQGGALSLLGKAIKAANYSDGTTQEQVLDMLKLQFPAMIKAIHQSLSAPQLR